MMEDLLIEDFSDNLHQLEEGSYVVVLEASDIFDLKKETITKLKNSRSYKERAKLLKKLRNLNKVKKYSVRD